MTRAGLGVRLAAAEICCGLLARCSFESKEPHMKSRGAGWLGITIVVLTAPSRPVSGQSPDAAELAQRLARMTAVTGYEKAMVDTILSLLPGAKRDRAGSAVLVLGSGEPRRLAACPLDETGFAVGRIRPDGWITLHRSPARAGLAGPLFDQQLEGQRVTVFGSRGPIPGVVAVRSVHLTRGRGPLSQEPFTVDDAYVDVGATSDRQAGQLGVAVLTPVAITKQPHRYGSDRLAAPWVGRRAACGALLAAARDVSKSGGGARAGTTVVAFVVEQQMGARGVLTLATNQGPFAETWIADAAGGGSAFQSAQVAAGPRAALGQLHNWEIATRYPGTPVETVSLPDVDRLNATISSWLKGEEPR
jgi:putative aminopeptidase FrvX